MIIRFQNGREIEAAILTRNEHTLRVAVKGGDDALEFIEINGRWVSEDCEPVQIEFAWQRRGRLPELSEVDFFCSQELAARLLRLLFTDSSEDIEAAEASPLTSAGSSVAGRMIV